MEFSIKISVTVGNTRTHKMELAKVDKPQKDKKLDSDTKQLHKDESRLEAEKQQLLEKLRETEQRLYNSGSLMSFSYIIVNTVLHLMDRVNPNPKLWKSPPAELFTHKRSGVD